MEKGFKFSQLLLLGLLLSCVFMAQARSLNAFKPGCEVGEDKDFASDLSLRVIKTSGPSPRGKGLGFTDADQALGGIKMSGPSPGEGHEKSDSVHE